MSSKSSVCSDSADSEVSVQSPLLPGMQTKSCVIEPASSPSMPKHALQAFKFLSTNSEAQVLHKPSNPLDISLCSSASYRAYLGVWLTINYIESGIIFHLSLTQPDHSGFCCF